MENNSEAGRAAGPRRVGGSQSGGGYNFQGMAAGAATAFIGAFAAIPTGAGGSSVGPVIRIAQ